MKHFFTVIFLNVFSNLYKKVALMLLRKQRKVSKKKKACERYQDPSEQEKKKATTCMWTKKKSFWRREKQKHQYGRDRCKNIPEYEKQMLVEYLKNYSRMHKNKDRQDFSG